VRPASVNFLLDEARGRLATKSGTARLDAEVLMQKCLDRNRAWLLAHGEHVLTDADATAFRDLVARRNRGEPVAYLTGVREFWSLPLHVDASVLIPRPETELVVERALETLPADRKGRILDLGTGSGAIALALATERPLCTIVATDRSARALEIARNNAISLGCDRVEFRLGEWFAPVTGEQFDVIVCNPPYVADDDPHLARGDVAHEPGTALRSGPDGTRDLAAVIGSAPAHLATEGWLIVEHGPHQADFVAQTMQTAGFTDITCYRDLAGLPRVSEGRIPAVTRPDGAKESSP